MIARLQRESVTHAATVRWMPTGTVDGSRVVRRRAPGRRPPGTAHETVAVSFSSSKPRERVYAYMLGSSAVAKRAPPLGQLSTVDGKARRWPP